MTEQEKKELNKYIGNIVVALFWLVVIFGTLYGLGGMPLVLNGIGLIIGVPIFGLVLWGIYKAWKKYEELDKRDIDNHHNPHWF